ncbi:MAG: aminodeoxychorismate/anthranilate synthase component II [Bacteriovoracales bacterium]|nr:aminodeoxychorismate/anthranilate synthase component II [Bacteriovoracales bacterium]
MKALLIDFEDSFTHNVAHYLYAYGISYRSVHWRDYEENHSWDLVILGPGPGSALDYREFLEKIAPSLEGHSHESSPFYFGICLGHQLLGLWADLELYRSRPLHGQRVESSIPRWNCFPKKAWGKRVFVQRYNSWSLRGRPSDSEMSLSEDAMFLRGRHFLSYQFHPESIGTSCPRLFFESVFKLAYNKKS